MTVAKEEVRPQSPHKEVFWVDGYVKQMQNNDFTQDIEVKSKLKKGFKLNNVS